jgi:DNA invertase Pin-like site-specific DNA recombinase
MISQKAVLYLRVINNSYAQSELVTLRKLQICNDFIILDQPIIEVGGSYNTLISNRMEIKRLLNLVIVEKVDAVICRNLNNLSRYPLEQIALEKALIMNNCRLISADLVTPAIDEIEELRWAARNFYFPRKEEHSC